MVKSILTLMISAFLLLGCESQAQDVKLKTKRDSTSYALGMVMAQQIAGQLKAGDTTLNSDAMSAGYRDALKNAKLKLNDVQMQALLGEFQTTMTNKADAKKKEMGKESGGKGQTFLENNKKNADVVVLPSGLQYKIMKSGSGASPSAEQTVQVHYKGTLIDGKEFDSSYKRGQPAEFQVGGVIKGWTEALKLMKVGDKWMLFIPSDLAYGDHGAGGDIGPNETLIFEVELLAIK